jgi:C-terminal of Roc, COR, domain/Effector-associated domain 11
VKTLKTGIFKQLPHLEYLGAPIPKLYDAIRQELRRIKTDKPYLLFEDYKNLCQRMDETPDKIMQNDTNIETLTTFLHDTGSLICYRYATKKKNNVLDNYVFIDPKWVITTIYAILDDIIRQNNGEFTTTHVAEVLETHQNVIRDAAIWLGLMTEFELIFKKRHTDTVFIAPQYLPLICSDLSVKAWDNLVEKLPHQLVLWYPDFLPKSVISRFICLNGNLAKDYYWKYGIVINTDGEDAWVHCDYNAKHITIQTHTPLSALAVKLFDILRGIDATDSLEIALQHNNETANKIGFVHFKELKERADKKEVNWNGQYFEVAPFLALLGNAHGFASSEKEKADTIETNRMIGRIDKQNKPKPTIDEIKPIIQPLNSEIMSIETVKNQVRDYIAKARTDHAISVIESWAKGNKAFAAQNAIAMIQADYRKLRSEEMLGIAENVGQRTATINYRILNFEWQLDAPSPVGETPKGVTITQPPSSGSITMKILFIASNPSDQTRLQTDKEHRLIKAEMERGSHRDKFEFLPPQFAVTITELLRAMNDKPQIVHFSGHGMEEGIVITTEANASQLLPIPAIKRLFRPLQNVAKVVLLNAYSAAQAEEISKFDCYVVGYTKPIGDAAAIGFAQGLYNGLGEGKSFEDAYNDAMIVLLTIAEQYAEIVEVWKNGMKVSL